HPDDHDPVRERVSWMLKYGERAPLKEERFLRLDGQVIHVGVVASPIIYENRPAVMVMFQNITERLRAEEALRESEVKFRALAETTAMAIIVYQDDHYVYANPATEKLTGYTREELFRMSFWGIIHPDAQPMIRERGMARLRGEAVPSRYEICYRTKDGQDRFAEFNGSLMNYNGRPAGLITAQDITQRKRAEKALQESEEK